MDRQRTGRWQRRQERRRVHHRVQPGPLRIGDELIYYYGASSWGKNHPPGKRVTGGGIFRARLRPDGIVSVDAGTLTTRPLVCSGSNLSVNAIGPVQVELLEVNAQPLDATTLSGDSLAHQVRFGNRTLRDVAGDGPFRLRLAVGSRGRVYSFTIH